MHSAAHRIREREHILPDADLKPNTEYRAMLGGRWYRVLYLSASGVAGGKQMHRFRWLTGPRAGQTQGGWAAFRAIQ